MKRWSPFGPLRYLSGETRGLARDSSLLGVGQGATTIGMMMQIALITHELGLRQYGLFALVVAVVALADRFFSLDVSRTSIVFAAPHLERNIRAAAGVFQFGYLASIATGVLGFAVVAGMAPFVGPRLIGSHGVLLIVLYGLTLLSSTGDLPSTALLQALGRFRAIAALTVFREITRIAFVGVAVFVFHSIVAVIALLLAHDALVGALGIGVAARAFRRRAVNVRLWQPALAEARGSRRGMLGMMFYTNLIGYAQLLQAQGPTLLLGALTGPVTVGIFKIGMAAAAAVGQLMTPAWSAVMPRLARLWTERDFRSVRQLMRQSTFLAAGVLVPAATVTVLLRGQLLTLFAGHEAVRAGTTFALLASAQVVNGILFWNGPLLYASHRVRVLTAIGLPSVALTLVLVFVLARAWGVDGAAIALLVSAVVANGLQTAAALRALRDDERHHAVAEGDGGTAPLYAIPQPVKLASK